MPGKRPGGRLWACLAKSAIALRPATPADAEFCYQLHKAAMGEYITAIWGWDEQVWRKHSARARTWFSTCSPSTPARKRSTGGLA